MRSLLILSFLMFVAIGRPEAQVPAAASNMKTQAYKMGTAFVSGDYKLFTTYVYLALLKATGGAQKMIELLNKNALDMKGQGMSFKSTNFEEPSKIIKSKSELQATIIQHTEIQLVRGRLVSTSTLIAISSDNGVSWTFMDTSNKDMATLRKAFPNLSSSITLPPPQKPVHYNQ